jgi:hemoglobin
MSEASLYERLGGGGKIKQIVADVWANHTSNPLIKNRYAKSDGEKVKQVVWEFFCAGTGGPQEYTGDDMLTAHRGMNISDEEFNAVTDDVLKALDKNEVGKKERDEVLVILYSMKGEIAHV